MLKSNKMDDSKTIAALDIGTGKMLALIGEIIDGKKLNILSYGINPSAEIKKGDILDLRKAAQSAQAAISNAEKTTSASIKEICLGISGTHIDGFRNIGTATVSSSDGAVNKADMQRACEDAQSKTISEDRVFIHNICCGYYIDGEYVSDPLGKKGTTLEAEFFMVHADRERIKDAMHLVQSFGMEVDQLMLNALASARVVTTPQQRHDGVLVMDIGCGTTDFAFIKHGRIFYAGVVPIGGDHLTNDLSFGLQMSRKNAEKLKLRFGKLILTDEEKLALIATEGDRQIGDRDIPLEAISKILNLRMDELFSIVRYKLEEFFLDSEVREIVITGMSSNLSGINQAAERFFQVRCEAAKFGSQFPSTLCHPENAAVLGILEYGLSKAPLSDKASGKSITKKIINIFKK